MSRIPDPILVTGGGGFVGSHLVERLVASGYRVRAFIHYNSTGATGWLQQAADEKKIEIFAGDIRDYDSVRGAVSGCATVFHLAALIGIPYSFRSPLAYVKTNVEGTYNVLEACRREEVQRVFVTSTSEVYGEALSFPINEHHPVAARSPYAASKIGADQLAGSYHASFGLPLTIIRPFNIFGPRQSTRAIIPTVMSQILGGAGTLHLGNLHPTRDWTYVEDSVAAFEKIAEKSPLDGRVVQVGSGRECSVADLVEQVARLAGRKIQVIADSERVRSKTSEVSRLLCDYTRLNDLTGWSPAHSLESGLEKTMEWVRSHPPPDTDYGYTK